MASQFPIDEFGPDLEQLGAIGGLLTPRENYIPNIQSVYGDIIQNAADYQYFTAPLSNQGRTTATYGGQNNIVVAPDTPIRVVDNATGQVVYSGVGYEGAQGAIDAANALSASTGKKANWDIQVAGPTMQGFQSVSTDRPDVSGLGIVADIALPVAASLLVPGGGLLGTILPAAGGSALSSVAQGRSIEDTLLRAAIAGGGAGLGELAFAPAQVASQATTQAATQAGTQAAGQAATQAAASAVPSAVGDIVVTALGGIPTAVGGAFGSLATSLLPSAFDAAQLNNIPAVNQAPAAEPVSDYVVTAQVPAAATPAPTIPGILPQAAPTTPAFNPAEDIVATAQTQPVTPTPVVLPPVTPTAIPSFNPAEDIIATAQTQTQPVTPTPVIIPPVTATPNVPAPNPVEDIQVTAPRETQVITPPAIPPVILPAATTPPTPTTTLLPAETPVEDIVVTANQPTNLLPAALLTPAAVAAAATANAAGATTTAAEQAATRTTPTAEETAALNAGAGAGGVLGTGLTATQLATLASLGVSGLSSLFGGGSGGGAGAGTPYVSALGAMPNFAPRTLVNPNITDYERYGFGPEALFFSDGQAINTYTPPAATTPAPTSAQGVLNAAAGAGASPATSGALQPISATPTTTQPAMGVGPFPTSQVGGGVLATPENTGMTQQRLDQLQDRFENMRSGEFFNYFKSVNDVLGNYAAKGYITPEQGKEIQGRLEAAASVPGATLASLQAAVPMPQISDFLKPTGTQRPVAPTPAPMQPMTYTPPAQPITDPNRYINDLYKQLGAQVSQGKLSVEQARNIQSQLRQNLVSQSPNIQTMQNIYNTAIQQYRPLI